MLEEVVLLVGGGFGRKEGMSYEFGKDEGGGGGGRGRSTPVLRLGIDREYAPVAGSREVDGLEDIGLKWAACYASKHPTLGASCVSKPLA